MRFLLTYLCCLTNYCPIGILIKSGTIHKNTLILVYGGIHGIHLHFGHINSWGYVKIHGSLSQGIDGGRIQATIMFQGQRANLPNMAQRGIVIDSKKIRNRNKKKKNKSILLGASELEN